jgi:hypothetical protein
MLATSTTSTRTRAMNLQFPRWRGRIVAGAAACAVLALLVSWFWRGAGGDETPAPGSADAAAPKAGVELRYPPRNFPGPIELQASPDEVELCGYGTIPGGLAGVPADIQRHADSVLGTLAANLARSALEAERATGLVLQLSLVAEAASRQAMLQRPGCESDTTCLIEVGRTTARAARPGADALARQAAATRDPLVYASAINACAIAEAQESSSACATLRPEQWAQLDPDNAIPWLLSAQEATRRRDVGAADSAMQRAARARQVDWRLAPVLMLLPRLPYLQEPVRAVVTAALLGAYGGTLEMARSLPALELCTKATVADAARRVACNDVAELLLAKGTTLMDHSVGAGIGSRVGWQASRLQALNEERQRLVLAFQVSSPPPNTLGCDWMAASQRWMSDIAREGELGFARRAAAARDETRR